MVPGTIVLVCVGVFCARRLLEWPRDAERDHIIRTMSRSGADPAVIATVRSKLEAARERDRAKHKPRVKIESDGKDPGFVNPAHGSTARMVWVRLQCRCIEGDVMCVGGVLMISLCRCVC